MALTPKPARDKRARPVRADARAPRTNRRRRSGSSRNSRSSRARRPSQCRRSASRSRRSSGTRSRVSWFGLKSFAALAIRDRCCSSSSDSDRASSSPRFTSCALTVTSRSAAILLQGRHEIGDIPGDQSLNARDGRARRLAARRAAPPRAGSAFFPRRSRPEAGAACRSRSASVQIAVIGITSSCSRIAPAP